MTLNITVATRKRIYQCADFAFQDWPSGNVVENPGNQKIRFVQTTRWRATVSFNGVGSFDGCLVGDWLLERLGAIGEADPFDRLLEELRTFDSWVARIPAPHNCHSFSVGAFVETRPVLALVSNYERPNGGALKEAERRLTAYKWAPTEPRTHVYGQRNAVTREERWNLANLAAAQQDAGVVGRAIADINRKAATRNRLISAGCFTNYIAHTGGGAGLAHGIESKSLPLAISQEAREIADQHFGKGLWRSVGFSVGSSAPTKEHHRAMLEERPDDPNAHSNYGAFLKDKEGDVAGAERAYRRALELDPKHALALGNLALVLVETGRKEEGEACYERALEAQPGLESHTWNYVTYLLREGKSRPKRRELLDNGVTANPHSARLLIKRAFLNLEERRYGEALADFMRARSIGGDQAQVEPGIAFSLHLSGAPIDECIAAYRTGIAVAPGDGNLKVNLAQLMFIKGNTQEATRVLEGALSADLDAPAELEALFYRLAHIRVDSATVERVRTLYKDGARLDWDVRQNVERIRQRDGRKAAALDSLRMALGAADRTAQVTLALAKLSSAESA